MLVGAVLALLDTVTFPELLTLLVIGLVVLGPEKLPGMARQAGEWMAKVRSVAQNLQREVNDVLDEPEMQSLRELGEFAARPRAKIAEYARNISDDDSSMRLTADSATEGSAGASSAGSSPSPAATRSAGASDAESEPETT